MTPPRSPSYVQFYPTLRCNLSCGFCFNRGIDAGADAEPDVVARMLETLGNAGVRALDLLGGEPTLHPRLGDLVREIARRGMRITLSTNGSGALELLERLEDEIGGEQFRVGVSVNTAPVPPALGSYIARRRPMLKSVCTRAWAPGSVVDEHLAHAGAEFFLLFMDTLTPGDGEGSLSFPEYHGRLRGVQRRRPRVGGVWCGGFLPDLGSAPDLAAARCPAGTTKLAALPDGSVYPCYLLFRRSEFRLGSLATDPFERIWGHPALDFFRTFRGNACPRRECEHHAACHGGCPAVSLMVAGRLAAPDPRCCP